MTVKTAKWIFYFGTISSAILFLALTWDTHNEVAALTHADKLSEEVIAGKHVFQKYNCNDCHTILGFGSYYGPDLTTVYQRRGEARVRTAILTPERVTTWRKMAHKPLSEMELADLLAFFRWVGQIDTHDWPPQDRQVRLRAAAAAQPGSGAEPAGGALGASGPVQGRDLHTAARRALAAGIGTGAELFREKGCFDCHRINQVGGDEGPDLTRVGARLTAERIDSLLVNPASVNPRAEMEAPGLSAAERTELVRFLSGLSGGGNQQ